MTNINTHHIRHPLQLQGNRRNALTRGIYDYFLLFSFVVFILLKSSHLTHGLSTLPGGRKY